MHVNLRLKTGLLIAFTLTLLGGVLYAKSDQASSALASWYSETEGASRYETIRRDLLVVFQRAVKLGDPLWILTERLSQGAAKRVRPDALLRAMQSEPQLIAEAVRIVSASSLRPGDTMQAEHLARDVAVYLRSGLSDEEVSSLFAVGAGAGRSSLDVLRACATLLSIDRISRSTPQDEILIGTALLTSRLESSAFATVGSFYGKAMIAHLAPSDAAEMISSVLEQGGGLIQLEQELTRRRGNR